LFVFSDFIAYELRLNLNYVYVDTFKAISIVETNTELSCEPFRGELAENPGAPGKIHSEGNAVPPQWPVVNRYCAFTLL